MDFIAFGLDSTLSLFYRYKRVGFSLLDCFFVRDYSGFS